ncbi:unnamed protein product, partial [Allacma fusca]
NLKGNVPASQFLVMFLLMLLLTSKIATTEPFPQSDQKQELQLWQTVSKVLLTDTSPKANFQKDQETSQCTLKICGSFENLIEPTVFTTFQSPQLIIPAVSLVPPKVSNINKRDAFGAYKIGLVPMGLGTPVTAYYDDVATSELTTSHVENYLEKLDFVDDVFRHRHLTIHSFPFKIHITRDKDGRPIGGLGYNFVRSMADKYNFTFDYRHENHTNHRQNADGSWNGFLAFAADCRTDMIVWFGDTYQRDPYLDFTPAVFNHPVVFFATLPKTKLNWYGIAYVFSSGTWLCVVISLLIVIPLFYARLRYFTSYETECCASTETPLFYSVVLPLCALLQQDCGSIPKNVRALMGLFLFYSIVIGTCFNSNLISFLTYPDSEPVPDSPQELSEMTDFTIKCMHYPGAAEDLFFTSTKIPLFLKIKARMENVNTKLMARTLMETVVGTKIAVINYLGIAMVEVVQNITLHPNFYPFKRARVPLFDNLVSIALRKYSKYTKIASKNVGMLQNTGHFEKWFDQTLDVVKKDGIRWLKKVRKEGPKHGLGYEVVKLTEEAMSSETKPFTLVHFGLAFYCLIWGLVLSSVWFMYEARDQIGCHKISIKKFLYII